ncbi:MAG: LytTR family transcriptional regulator [Prevotellaceae bacterium]|jgi:hypothetical protein|nr:LytTR family transcriptional regulator [Prevotellaceae bacterium]
MNKSLKLTVRLSAEGKLFPIAYEMPFGVEEVAAHLKLLGVIGEVSSRFKPVLVPYNSGYKCVRAQEILYLESDGSYCTIYFGTGKKIFVAVPMGTLADDFCEQGIVRCHKRFAVNINEVDFVGGNYLILRGEKHLNVGGVFKEAVMACFTYRGTRSAKFRQPLVAAALPCGA